MNTHLAHSTRLLAGAAAAGLLAALSPAVHAQTNLVPPQLRNLVSAQRAGTFLVDISYDLIDPDSPYVCVSVEASSNGGVAYTVPMVSLSGDFGYVTPGTGKHLVWNAWTDWAGNYTTNAKVRLVADDTASAGVAPPSLTNGIPTSLVWVPSGSFNMSGTLVYLSKGFFMAKCEVTQAEYLSVMSNNPSSFTGSGARPVEHVTWFEATNYCGRLTVRESAAGRTPAGWTYRLPTDAEWEFACRAGTTNTYYFGNDAASLGLYAWYSGNAESATHAVGLKAPNRWGLQDMSGNVWEWCLDWYTNSLPGGNVTDPQGPLSGSGRVIRGGGFDGTAIYCTSTFRSDEPPSNRGSNYGFRVVLAPGQ